ncbi:hypothetical protein M0R19_00645 [Candidatus Pacearchaeota archaeon]|jgi:hypothetical protein|nr:hypothetical protein [Candidatus Pacearchaeota archaeon]
MKYLNLEEVLQPKQKYVQELSSKIRIDIKAVEHEIATNTCFEKAELINWPAERVVKAIFFYKEDLLYGFIFPELGTKDSPKYIDSKEIFPRILGCTKKQSKKFSNSYCPEGMEHGTCTPFVLDDSFQNPGKRLTNIFIHDFKELKNKLVDISIGGFGERAHKISLHLPYEGIYEILNYKFGDKIQKINLFENL